jgi:hypothetical protein
VRKLVEALRALLDLFLEDGSLAVAILICVAGAMLVAHRGGVPLRWRGPLLVAGLAVVLLENVQRTARDATPEDR